MADASKDTQTCPYCAETVKAAAIKCRYCGSDLRTQPGSEPAAARRPTPVTVTDIKMSFWSMVEFMVMWVVASIPALIILGVLAMVAMMVFGTFLHWR